MVTFGAGVAIDILVTNEAVTNSKGRLADTKKIKSERYKAILI